MIEPDFNCKRVERRSFADDNNEVDLNDDADLKSDDEIDFSVLIITLRGRSRVAKRFVDKQRFVDKRRFVDDNCK